MNILFITYPLSALLIFTLVIGLAIFIVRKYRLGWRLFFIGAAGFIISQIFHIPFNLLVLNPLIQNQIEPAFPEVLGFAVIGLLAGLSAGFFEEFTRYSIYRWWTKEARTWAKGVLLGNGWGGIEAILVGGIILFAFIRMIALIGVDLSSIVPAEQLVLAQQRVEAYWSIPWSLSMLGLIERAFAIPIQISLSLMVLQVFTRGQIRWLWIAIGFHTLVDAPAVFLLFYWSEYEWAAYAIEGVVAILAIISLIIIFALKQPEPEPEPESEPPPEPAEVTSLPEIDESPENIDDTRYN